MKPSDLDYKLLQKEDERLIRFKESEWERLGHPDPEGMFVLCFIMAIPVFGWSILLLGLLHEILSKYWRMFVIASKAGYLHTKFAIVKWVDKTETKLFDIWRKMI